jgi:hypothetical protein
MEAAEDSLSILRVLLQTSHQGVGVVQKDQCAKTWYR